MLSKGDTVSFPFRGRSFRSRPFRAAAIAALAAATVGTLLVVAPAASAAGGPSVVLNQDTGAATIGDVHTVTATVTGADGLPAPDGPS